MIYLICAKDSKQRVAEINDKDTYKTNLFYKYFVENFEHKNILYPLDFYTSIIKEIIPNRVNVIYADKSIKTLPNIVNGIVSNNIREIIKAYRNEIDDVYIFATSKWIIEEFHQYADYIIVFSCDEIGYTLQYLSDILDFSNYDLLRNENVPGKKYRIEYFVNNNKVGK